MVLVDSFSSLCHKLQRKEYFQDGSNVLYHFGAMKIRVEEILNGERDASGSKKDKPWYEPVLPEVLQNLRDILTFAEKEGRVFWRVDQFLSSENNIDGFVCLLEKIRALGGAPEDFKWNVREFGNAYWNVPAMRDYFSKHGIRVEYAFRV